MNMIWPQMRCSHAISNWLYWASQLMFEHGLNPCSSSSVILIFGSNLVLVTFFKKGLEGERETSVLRTQTLSYSKSCACCSVYAKREKDWLKWKLQISWAWGLWDCMSQKVFSNTKVAVSKHQARKVHSTKLICSISYSVPGVCFH